MGTLMKNNYLAFTVVVAFSAQSQAADLHLLCQGGGAAVKHSIVDAYAHSSDGTSITGSAFTSHDRPYAEAVKIDITDNVGRIEMPRGLLPLVHGGTEGWIELHEIVTTENEIVAKAAVNFMNNPRVRIDRISGTVTIEGQRGNFAGRCEAYDPANVSRRF
jgi:hypothetical protein